ncbi:MAG: hypothetical protein ACI4KF_05535 [Huintestinicola sp.]
MTANVRRPIKRYRCVSGNIRRTNLSDAPKHIETGYILLTICAAAGIFAGAFTCPDDEISALANNYIRSRTECSSGLCFLLSFIQLMIPIVTAFLFGMTLWGSGAACLLAFFRSCGAGAAAMQAIASGDPLFIITGQILSVALTMLSARECIRMSRCIRDRLTGSVSSDSSRDTQLYLMKFALIILTAAVSAAAETGAAYLLLR